MALPAFLDAAQTLKTQALAAFSAATDEEQLESARVLFLGAKKGRMKDLQKMLGQVDKSDKPVAGQTLNATKQEIQSAFESAKSSLGGAAVASGPTLDPTLPGDVPVMGHVHPITQTIEHLKEIMGRMGFATAEGPEVEDPWHNFVALNIPEDHPARDPLDNFYLATAATTAGATDDGDEGGQLLRSQTSTVQIRIMESTPPPIRIISLGRVYRPDPPDRTHFPMFHQMEGLLVDENVTMANLKTVLRVFANNYFGSEVEIRFRPSFFPFTEPSVEVDFLWNGQWMEFGGAGMVDPAVLTAVGYDPETVSGFAFGLGVERLCMRRHNILDIRDLFSGDLRFLQQF
ncbi:MAG: phenylalanine--tRNA ligase subunit alpha [Planctomycetota bacterium]